MRPGRPVFVVATLAALHFAATLTRGVLAFTSQGSFGDPGPPPIAHRGLSAVVDVLEFPFVWAVRRLSPERHAGFLPAAIGTSVLWGVVLGACLAVARRARRRRRR